MANHDLVSTKSHVRNTKGRPTNAIVTARRNKLREIINEMQKEGLHISSKVLLKKLEESKPSYKIDRITLYYDRKFLAENNTFVRDIAETTYSQMIEDIFNDITHISDQAIELAEKEWQVQKMKRKNSGGAPESTEETLEQNEAGPKEKFYRLALDCQNAKMNLLKGDVMNYSVAFLTKKLQTYKEELERIRSEYNIPIKLNLASKRELTN